MRYAAGKKLKIIRLVEQCRRWFGRRWTGSAYQAPPATADGVQQGANIRKAGLTLFWPPIQNNTDYNDFRYLLTYEIQVQSNPRMHSLGVGGNHGKMK